MADKKQKTEEEEVSRKNLKFIEIRNLEDLSNYWRTEVAKCKKEKTNGN